MAAEAHPALADHLIELVDVVQALKLKLDIHAVNASHPLLCALPTTSHLVVIYSVTSLHFNHSDMHYIMAV